MSSGYWQTLRQTEQLSGGRTTEERVQKYIRTWVDRCYLDIPDEVPSKIAKSGRAPSYKAISMCILRNDLKLHSLGFSNEFNKVYEQIKEMNNPQRRLL